MVSNLSLGRSGSVGFGTFDVRVMCGGNPGDPGKLAEAGKLVDVNLLNAAAGLYDSGGTSQMDICRPFFVDVILDDGGCSDLSESCCAI